MIWMQSVVIIFDDFVMNVKLELDQVGDVLLSVLENVVVVVVVIEEMIVMVQEIVNQIEVMIWIVMEMVEVVEVSNYNV